MADTVLHSYLPHTDDHRRAMLEAVGVPSIDGLFADIPAPYRDPEVALPPALTELELRAELEALAGRNAAPGAYACFLGGGVYRHFIPSVVGAMISRGEFLTSYTPYQPEVSQGTLQATYEFQSMVCELTGMEVANAGMYDGATAFAEAALMACRITHRYRVAVLDTVNPRYREVLRTYLTPQNVGIDVVSPDTATIGEETACILAQYPDSLGTVSGLGALVERAHAVGALAAVSAYPTALGMLRPPGEYGADIVTGECQPLGVSLSFGGPYIGLFACRERYLRQVPGRIVGRTVDHEGGRPGYVLTLQTREQHIRRERATSNICTSEALIGTATAVYLAALGPQGLRQVAELCYHKAHYASTRIAELPGYQVHPQHASAGHGGNGSGAGTGPVWFNEFVVRCPRPPRDINRGLLERRIIGGLDVSERVPEGMLLCVTEMNAKAEIDALVEALDEIGKAG